MDNILEILIPLIFAAIYFFGNMFSGKKEDEDMAPREPRRFDSEESDEEVERQRRIQEEIRRKIIERRTGASGGGPQPAASPQSLSRRSGGDEVRREAPAETEPREFAQEARAPQERASAQGQTAAHRSGETAKPSFSWEESDNAYDSAMQERLRQIEETKRRAARLKRQADAAHMKNEGEIGAPGRSRQERRSGYLRGPVRESLQDPQAARVAFIYGEVLGRPVGLRNASESNVPGLAR